MWNTPLKGPRANLLNDDIKRMLKTVRKYNTNLAAIKISPHLLTQLLAWYHLSAEQCPLNSTTAKCLLKKQNISKVADLVGISARIRHPLQHPMHQPKWECACRDCTNDKSLGCVNPHGCTAEALTRLNLIQPKYNPTKQDPPDGLSLTRLRKLRNEAAKQNKGEIIFDPTMTCKESLAECFRIFTNPTKTSNLPAKRYHPLGPTPRC
jgi:hypothetical protein